MISTYFGLDQLGSPPALFAALVIGLLFGFSLERAGFGSSRKMAGIFYFRDMTVLKVMFSALIVAMLGLSLAVAMGVVAMADVYAMPTVYGAQIVGGLVFGVGFVMGGWCPGTAAVGTASGKLDAVVFLGGGVIGSILFNETYGSLGWLHDWGAQPEPLFAFGVSRPLFGLLFTMVAVGAFYFAEWAESRFGGGSKYLRSSFLKAFGVALLIFAAALLIFPTGPDGAPTQAFASSGASEKALLASIEAGEDHMDPEALADRLAAGEADLVVVDVRPAAEYEAFHIRGAVNVALPELAEKLAPHKDRGTIVLYSTGMTHPAEARDSLARQGYSNVYILTDGLAGFVERCLKPVSLRDEPLSPDESAQVNGWRAFFLASSTSSSTAVAARAASGSTAGSSRAAGNLISTDWLSQNLGRPEVKVLDVRKQPEYNTAHIPGSLRIDPESFRGNVGGVPSLLLPADMLARHLSLMGVEPTDTVVLVDGGSVRDATLAGMALARLGHARWGVLDGGYARWTAENRPIDAAIPHVAMSSYPAPSGSDGFTVDADAVQAKLDGGGTVVLDSRPAEYFSGEKSDEARAGHIPGAVNRPYSDDLDDEGRLKPVAELEAAYGSLIPSKDTPVVVHCRTGHQASQTFFVLKDLLGYKNVAWYDGSWTDWAARPDLPVTR